MQRNSRTELVSVPGRFGSPERCADMSCARSRNGRLAMAIPCPGNDEFAGCFKQPTARLSMRNVHYSVSHHSARRSIRCLMKLRAVFGLNVQRLRRERKLSQEQLSFVSGRTRAYISSVEAGRRNATLDTVEIL